jgi:dihydroorotase
MTLATKIAIKGGHLIDPKNGINNFKDVYIDNGQIVSIAEPNQHLNDFNADQIIDASGLLVIPGLVDLRNRLREPGYKYKGTIASETYAAVSGGVTSLCCPPDTKPVIDSTAVIKQINLAAENEGFCHVYPMAAMTKGLLGQELSEMHSLIKAGCVGVSNALEPIPNTLVMRRAMEYAASHHITVFLHPQDYHLSYKGCVHEGPLSSRQGLAGIPESAETIALLRDLELVKLTGVKAHICQISTARSV